MKYKIIVIKVLVFCVLCGCSPKLTFYEIEQRINDNYGAASEGDIDYLLKNTPVVSLNKYGKKRTIDYWNEVYEKRTFPATYNDIGELMVKNRNKCNSYYYYMVEFIVDEIKSTPYLDSTALEFNQKKYGKEHVNFNRKLKTLQIRKSKSKILVFDKDRRWKVLDVDIQYLNDNFGEGFSDCIDSVMDSNSSRLK